MPDQLSNPREMGYMLAISQIGLEMVAPIALGVAIDFWIGTLPWLTIAGVFLGFFGGMAHLFVMVKRMEQDKDKPPTTPPEPQ